MIILVLLACAPKEEAAVAVSSGLPSSSGEPILATMEGSVQVETLTGVVQHKEWSKTTESWMAGGSDYYVLDVGGAPVKDQTADAGVILKPGKVGVEALAALDGQKVKVEGVYVAATVPQVEPTSQYPMNLDGSPLPSGGGFEVWTITKVE